MGDAAAPIRVRTEPAAKRLLTVDVTITPGAKKQPGASVATRISDAAQLAMVQAAVLQMRPPGVLAQWAVAGLCKKAFYSSELGQENHAHFQGWHQLETKHPQTEVPAVLLAAARDASGKKKMALEQKVRNEREKKALDDLRKCAARVRTGWPAAPGSCVCSHRRLLRKDVVEAFIDLEKCSYSTMLNIVKEGDEEKTKGYPGKEEGQVHLRTAVYGIGDEELRRRAMCV